MPQLKIPICTCAVFDPCQKAILWNDRGGKVDGEYASVSDSMDDAATCFALSILGVYQNQVWAKAGRFLIRGAKKPRGCRIRINVIHYGIWAYANGR
mmetsp:Transcript_16989/g.38231  ORF Transcript_16989/g.38231 Transcript_16989/m.38231 type:complete len:97 (-) Transcript_16989:1525-1815(-)